MTPRRKAKKEKDTGKGKEPMEEEEEVVEEEDEDDDEEEEEDEEDEEGIPVAKKGLRKREKGKGKDKRHRFTEKEIVAISQAMVAHGQNLTEAKKAMAALPEGIKEAHTKGSLEKKCAQLWREQQNIYAQHRKAELAKAIKKIKKDQLREEKTIVPMATVVPTGPTTRQIHVLEIFDPVNPVFPPPLSPICVEDELYIYLYFAFPPMLASRWGIDWYCTIEQFTLIIAVKMPTEAELKLISEKWGSAPFPHSEVGASNTKEIVFRFPYPILPNTESAVQTPYTLAIRYTRAPLHGLLSAQPTLTAAAYIAMRQQLEALEESDASQHRAVTQLLSATLPSSSTDSSSSSSSAPPPSSPQTKKQE
jgi:hypothetical protein